MSLSKIFLIVIVLGLIGGLGWWWFRPASPTPIVPVVAVPPTFTVPETFHQRVFWSSTAGGALPPLATQAQAFTVAPTEAAAGASIALVVPAGTKLAAKLQSPDGRQWGDEAAVTGQYRRQAQTVGDQTMVTYTLPPGLPAGTWELSLTNQSSSPVDYAVSQAPVPPPVTVSPQQPAVVAQGNTVTLNLTVVETVTGQSGLIVTAISGATVTATITAPNGQVYTVTLAEDPTAPGTYHGTFSGDLSSGNYLVEYHISGMNSAGQPFDEVIADNFVVVVGGARSSVVEKKFDINRSGTVQIIGY